MTPAATPTTSRRTKQPARTTEEPSRGTPEEPLLLTPRQIDALIALHVIFKDEEGLNIVWEKTKDEPDPYLVDQKAVHGLASALSALPCGLWQKFGDEELFVQSIPRYTIYYQNVAPLFYDLLDKHPNVKSVRLDTCRQGTDVFVYTNSKKRTVLVDHAHAPTTAVAMCYALLAVHGFHVKLTK